MFNKTILILFCIITVIKYKQYFFDKFEGITYRFYILLIHLNLKIKKNCKYSFLNHFWDNIYTNWYVKPSKTLFSIVIVIGDFTLRLLKNIKIKNSA